MTFGIVEMFDFNFGFKCSMVYKRFFFTLCSLLIKFNEGWELQETGLMKLYDKYKELAHEYISSMETKSRNVVRHGIVMLHDWLLNI